MHLHFSRRRPIGLINFIEHFSSPKKVKNQSVGEFYAHFPLFNSRFLTCINCHLKTTGCIHTLLARPALSSYGSISTYMWVLGILDVNSRWLTDDQLWDSCPQISETIETFNNRIFNIHYRCWVLHSRNIYRLLLKQNLHNIGISFIRFNELAYIVKITRNYFEKKSEVNMSFLSSVFYAKKGLDKIQPSIINLCSTGKF